MQHVTRCRCLERLAAAQVGRIRLRVSRARGLMNLAGSHIAQGPIPVAVAGGLVNRANTGALSTDGSSGLVNYAHTSGAHGSLFPQARSSTADMEGRPAFAQGAPRKATNRAQLTRQQVRAKALPTWQLPLTQQVDVA